MKKKLIPITLFTISLCCMISCNDSQKSVVPESAQSGMEILVPETAKIAETKSLRESYDNSDAIEFAKILAMSLKDKDMRQFLKDEANKKFDGDFDILVKNIVNTQIGVEKFDIKLSKNTPNGQAKGQEIIKVALKNEKLNISIPVLIEKWNIKNQIPLVGVSMGLVEGTTKFIKGFDHLGKEYIIDAVKTPNLPVIIIGENERVDEKGKLYQEKSKVQANDNIIGSQARITCVFPYRLDNKNEILKAMFITEQALDQVESWTLGAPEIRVECWSPVNSTNFSSLQKIGGPGTYFEPSNRAAIINKWWTLPVQQPLFQWVRSVNTRSVLFYFWEWDGNSGSKNVVITNTFKIPSQNGGPEVSTTITTTTTVPSSARDIDKVLIDQDVCPPSSYNGWGAYGGSFAWALVSQ